ncbi:MAG: polynucleotide adenylyltransferase PcnB [Thermoanaerobaculia bacterium]
MSAEPSVAPRILPRSEHPISRSQIAKEALKVLYRIAGAGRKAYLVGGGVRDLMLGRRPKDFDVTTDARPNELRRLFRNARIIGRRFRLVHVLFQDTVVEVATFRGRPAAEAPEGESTDALLITSDNNFGTAEEDAFRRDFTVNALFYDISDFSVIDYVGGVEDLERKVIRTIGDPWVRFREDPVRMLRACELAARLGFVIDAESQAAILELASEVTKASPARLAEEVVELMGCGRAGAALQWMLELGLLDHLIPEAHAILDVSRRGLGDFGRILPTLDRLVVGGRSPGEGALLAALLLPTVLLRRFDAEAKGGRPLRRDALRALVEDSATPFLRRFTLSKARSQETLDALYGFLDLSRPHRSAGERLHAASRPAFASALFLFELLVEATGEGHEELAQWHAAARRRPVLATAGESPTLAAPPAAPDPARRRPRKRRRR